MSENKMDGNTIEVYRLAIESLERVTVGRRYKPRCNETRYLMIAVLMMGLVIILKEYVI